MLRVMGRIGIVFWVLLFACQSSWADQDITMPIRVTIEVAASAVKTSDLDFGSLFPDPGGDDFILDATGQATANGTGTLATADSMSTTGGTTVSVAGQSGLIDITTSTDNINVTITAPDATLLPSGSSPDTITVTNISVNSTGSGASVNFATAGDYEIHIGGKLVIPPSLTADTYTGNVVITLAYD